VAYISGVSLELASWDTKRRGDPPPLQWGAKKPDFCYRAGEPREYWSSNL
jgi:hypothetical protein